MCAYRASTFGGEDHPPGVSFFSPSYCAFLSEQELVRNLFDCAHKLLVCDGRHGF